MNAGPRLSLQGLRIGAVLNTASGSCTEASAAELKDICAEYYIELAQVWCGDGSYLETAFTEADKASLDVLIVLGGDGTIRTAAERSRPTSPYLIPLPGGTMNVLPIALYGTHSWQEVLRNVLKNPVAKTVSGGQVHNARFFISAISGAPVLWANVREEVREGEFKAALSDSKVVLDKMFNSKIHYWFNEMHEGTAESVSVICPLISRSLEEDRQVFEVAIIDVHHIGHMIGMAAKALFSNWREDKNVAIVRTEQVTLTSHKPLPMILDGEPVAVGTKATFVFVPEAFRALVPEDEVLS